MDELDGDRYYFMARREGVINVGGMKVHPEEVEAIMNRHPGVQMSRVRGRRSPIAGALVVADVVVRPSIGRGMSQVMVDEILGPCRQALPPRKVPVTLRQVSSLDLGGSGKLLRTSS